MLKLQSKKSSSLWISCSNQRFHVLEQQEEHETSPGQTSRIKDEVRSHHPCVCVCPVGRRGPFSPRPCPRTPEPSRTPGPDHTTNGPVSVIYRPFTGRSHVPTKTRTHTRTASIRARRKAHMLNSDSHTRKECGSHGNADVYAEIMYEKAWGGRGGRRLGGREECDSFDMIRMVPKNNGVQKRKKR